MNPELIDTTAKYNFKYFRLPKTVIGRFVFRSSVKSAALWAIIFGSYVAVKAIGITMAYPTEAARMKFSATLANNIGFNAILGPAHNIGTVSGLTAWNCLIVMIIVGSIWAFLKATKTLRGEEDAGRWELLLSGQNNAKTACLNALAGLGASLMVMFVVISVAFILVGRVHNVDFGTNASIFFALTTVSGVAIFMAIGAFLSQLLPTRRRAAAVSTAVFGASYLIRAAADTTNIHWLLYLSPLGWVEKLQPLGTSSPVWLLPIAALIVVLVIGTVMLSSQRDLGDSIFADKDSSKPHTRFLNSPLGLAFRSIRGISTSWMVGIFLVSIFYSLLTKSATSALTSSTSLYDKFKQAISLTNVNFDLLWLGVLFYLMMMMVMAFVASSLGAVREEEADGYVDNIVVRPVSRLRWLSGRLLIIFISTLIAGLMISFGTWLGILNLHVGISFHQLLIAGINAVVPAMFVLGLGILILGYLPRLTTTIAYTVIAWSFLISIVKSGVNLNHWILDTSILQHISLAPAVNPTWKTSIIVLIISLILAILGILRFNSRDLQSE